MMRIARRQFLRGRFSSVRQAAGSGVDCGPTVYNGNFRNTRILPRFVVAPRCTIKASSVDKGVVSRLEMLGIVPIEVACRRRQGEERQTDRNPEQMPGKV